jgi:hypothetical protein
MKFKKRPVVIEAWKASDLLASAKKSWDDLPEPIKVAYETGDIFFLPAGILVDTWEGQMRAEPEDWVIRGINGEFYPCKPDIFEATYDVEH